MTRWTMVAVALAAAACKQGGNLARQAESARARAETTMGGAETARTQAESALSSARARMGRTDTGAAAARAPGETGAARAETSATAAPAETARAAPTTRPGGAAPSARATSTKGMRVNLSADQVRQLQTALNQSGCNAGPVDGIVGPKTRQGIACGMKKNNIRGQDLNALYRALNLNF